MIFVFYILAALLIYLSYKSLRGGIDYLNYFKKELAKPQSDYAPFATVIAPCKGLDNGLEENLSALLDQTYTEYEVIFVVDDKDDPAVSAIEKLLNRRDAETQRNENSASRHLGGEKLIVAPKSTESSQKVENLREAVLHTDERSEVFIFVDSDARPSKFWLRSIVAPLKNETVGASTGYRWFISSTPSFASELRNIWNASIATALGPNTKDNFCWGGSMAIRRDVFEKLDIREKWRGTLSDDFTVTRAMNAASLPIVFVAQALTPSVEDCSFREMLEFTTRQMKITRVYSPKLWVMSFAGSGLFCIVMLTSLLVIASGRNNVEVIASILTLGVVTAMGVGKSWLRLKAVRMVLTDHDAELKKQILPQLTLWLLSPLVFFYDSVAALLSRRMVWRGTAYELVSPTETRVLNSDALR